MKLKNYVKTSALIMAAAIFAASLAQPVMADESAEITALEELAEITVQDESAVQVDASAQISVQDESVVQVDESDDIEAQDESTVQAEKEDEIAVQDESASQADETKTDDVIAQGESAVQTNEADETTTQEESVIKSDEQKNTEDNAAETSEEVINKEVINLEEDVNLNSYEAGAKPSSLMLGIFFTSQQDQSDTLFVSFNGIDFYKLGYAYEDQNKSSETDNRIVDGPVFPVNCLHDPALQFAKGGYWSMSGYTDTLAGSRRFIPMISFSSDLINWSYPASGSATNIKPTVLPFGKAGNRDNANFDSVAPELFFDDNGDAYIVVCMGYYAMWHGESEYNDRMSAYLIKASGLTPGSMSPTTQDEKSRQPVVTYSDAVPINLPDTCSDRIDGHLYKEGGKYYLSIKRNGFINEIWSINSLNNVQNPSAWTKVREIVTKGYEGPCLTKFSNQYYMYSDGLESYYSVGTTGIFVSTSKTLSGDWTKNVPVNFYIDKNKNKTAQRHGSVITITNAAQIDKIMAMYNSRGYQPYTASMSKAFTGSNPQSFHLCWSDEKGKSYWMENSKRQAVQGDPKNIIDVKFNRERGREIYDPTSNGWYWLDSIYDGAKAVGKEVWMPYIYQQEKSWDNATKRKIANESDHGMEECVYNALINGDGKWVRYNEYGAMMKGWVTISGEQLEKLYPDQIGNTYYYDTRTGLMAKGRVVIGGKAYFFDPITGVLR